MITQTLSKPLPLASRRINPLTIPLLALAVLAGFSAPTSATLKDCLPNLKTVEQGLRTRMPADPELAKKILKLQHEGRQSCQTGAAKAGREKLQQATALLQAGSLTAHQTQP